MLVGFGIGFEIARILSPAMLLAGSVGIIVTAFISLTHLQSALFLQAICALTAVMGTGIVFEQIYECVCFTRSSEQILARLRCADQLYLKGMTRMERLAIMKRAKAFQPIRIPLGGFCHVSMGVIRAAWEEILNQLLFLLSM